MDYPALSVWPLPLPRGNDFRDHFTFSPNPVDEAHGLWITEMGHHSYFRLETSQVQRSLPNWTYLFVTSGRVSVRLGNGRGWAEAGEVLLLPPWRVHLYWTEHPWSSAFIHFTGGRAPRLAGRRAGSPWPVFRERDPAGTWRAIAEMVSECRLRGAAAQPLLASRLESLLKRLKAEWRSGGGARLDQGAGTVAKVGKWMRDRVDRRLTAAEMAATAGLSTAYFSRLWKRHTGRSPVDYFIDLKLLRARDLLAKTDVGVGAVAERMGFEDALYFSRLFRRRIGMSPTTYRHNMRGK